MTTVKVKRKKLRIGLVLVALILLSLIAYIAYFAFEHTIDDKIKKVHSFDSRSMGTVFPFTSSEVGHDTGIPLGFNKQTGTPILFDNFHHSLTNYNMVIFAKSGAGKSVTMKTLISRSSVLMGI